MLCDVAIVERTHSRYELLAMLTMKKELHAWFLFLCMHVVLFLCRNCYGTLLGGPSGCQNSTRNKNYPYHTSPSYPKTKTKLKIQHYSNGKSSTLCPHNIMSSSTVYLSACLELKQEHLESQSLTEGIL